MAEVVENIQNQTSAPAPAPSQGVSSPSQGVSQGVSSPAASPPASDASASSEASAWASIRDAAKGYGYDLSSYQDDHTALQALILRAREAESQSDLVRYGQHYLQHQGDFQRYLQWRQEQEQRAQAEAQKQQAWWKAPEYDPRWRQMVQKDPNTGRLIPAEGAPPDVVQKYLTAAQHSQDFFDKFAFDPVGTIKPGIEEVAKEIALQVVKQHLGGFSDTMHAQNYVSANSSWLHQRDQQGNVVYGQDGRPQLSTAGRLFAGHVQNAISLGIQDEGQRAAYARSMVERDLAIHAIQARQAQAAQQTQGEQAKQQFLQNASGGGAAQHVPAAGGSTQAPVQNGKLPLLERLRQRASQLGVTDATLAANGR